MTHSDIRRIHEEKWAGFKRTSFFKYRDVQIHRVRKVRDGRWYFLFSTEDDRGASFMRYRVGKFSSNGNIQVLGTEGSTKATKFTKLHSNGEFPNPKEVDKNISLDNSTWLSGSEIYG